RGTVPQHRTERAHRTPTLAQIQRAINRLGRWLSHSGAIPSDVAGRATYTLRAAPRKDGGLLGGAAVAWDAARGVPLRLALYARGHSDPVLELEATDISFGPVPASDFAVSPPPGVKTVDLTPGHARAHAEQRSALGFRVVAPLEVRGLTKVYGDIVAVDQVDLTVAEGNVYGYLGPNGAGKTTSLRMMLGLIRPTAGHVQLFGRDPQLGVQALEGVAGFVEEPHFYPYLSGRRNLELLAAFDGGDAAGRVDEVLSIVELSDRGGDRVRAYSHGMRQRLGIAGALLRGPRLLLLDEPTTGLDPAGMRDMRTLVRRLASGGMTILLSSHLLYEVEDLCNRVAIVRRGRVVYEGSLAELKASAATSYRLRAVDLETARRVATSVAGIGDVVSGDGELRFTAGEEAVAMLTVALGRAGVGFTALVPRTASLEELFLDLTEGEQPPLVQEVA